MQYCLIVYCVILNVVGLFSMRIDKRKAQKREWRIAEKTLLGIAAFGGSLGSLLGMYWFRHKTKHPLFVIGIPVILLIQIVVLAFLYFYLPNPLF